MSVFGVFVVRIFPHLHGIRRDTEYLPVFSPNAGKYALEKTPNTDTFHAVYSLGKVYGYWMKGYKSLHKKMQLELRECLERESAETPPWMTKDLLDFEQW